MFGDSSLIINQVSGAWKIRNENLALYQNRVDQLIQQFTRITFTYLLREENQFANALAKLSWLINIPHHMRTLPILVEQRNEPAYTHAIDDDEPPSEPWYQVILNYKEHGEYPPNTDTRGKRAIQRQASQFTIELGQLLKKTPQGTLLTCVSKKKGTKS